MAIIRPILLSLGVMLAAPFVSTYAATIPTTPDFSVVVLPDPQGEVGAIMPNGTQPDYLSNQIDWIISNKDTDNIRLVLSVGDNVPGPSSANYALVRTQFQRLAAAGVPYLAAVGNHDNILYASFDPSLAAEGINSQWIGTSLFDAGFPTSDYSGLFDTFGTKSGSGGTSYGTLDIDGFKLLTITVPFGATQDDLSWARSIAAAHPDHHTILLTHDYLGDDNQVRGDRPSLTTTPACDWYQQGFPSRSCVYEDALITNPGATTIPGATSGLAAWQQLVKVSPNIQFVFSGHVASAEHMSPNGPAKGKANPTETAAVVQGHYTRVNDVGGLTFASMFNAQSWDGDGDGRVEGGGLFSLVRFHPAADTVDVSTVSPVPGITLPNQGSDGAFTWTDATLSKRGGYPLWDITSANPFADDIYAVTNKGLQVGWDDHTWRPGRATTRGAMAMVLYRSLPGYQAGTLPTYPSCSAGGIQSPFSDVPDEYPFCYSIAYDVANGIVTGYNDGTFRPAAQVSRQGAAAILARSLCFAAGRPLTECSLPNAAQSFNDVGPNSPFFGQIQWLTAQGITTGYADGGFHPGDPLSRQAFASWLVRSMSLCC